MVFSIKCNKLLMVVLVLFVLDHPHIRHLNLIKVFPINAAINNIEDLTVDGSSANKMILIFSKAFKNRLQMVVKFLGTIAYVRFFCSVASR